MRSPDLSRATPLAAPTRTVPVQTGARLVSAEAWKRLFLQRAGGIELENRKSQLFDGRIGFAYESFEPLAHRRLSADAQCTRGLKTHPEQAADNLACCSAREVFWCDLRFTSRGAKSARCTSLGPLFFADRSAIFEKLDQWSIDLISRMPVALECAEGAELAISSPAGCPLHRYQILTKLAALLVLKARNRSLSACTRPLRAKASASSSAVRPINQHVGSLEHFRRRSSVPYGDAHVVTVRRRRRLRKGGSTGRAPPMTRRRYHKRLRRTGNPKRQKWRN